MSTFVSDFSPRAAPVIASASFLAFAANAHPQPPEPRRAAAVPKTEVERAHVAALLRGGLSGA